MMMTFLQVTMMMMMTLAQVTTSWHSSTCLSLDGQPHAWPSPTSSMPPRSSRCSSFGSSSGRRSWPADRRAWRDRMLGEEESLQGADAVDGGRCFEGCQGFEAQSNRTLVPRSSRHPRPQCSLFSQFDVASFRFPRVRWRWGRGCDGGPAAGRWRWAGGGRRRRRGRGRRVCGGRKRSFSSDEIYCSVESPLLSRWVGKPIGQGQTLSRRENVRRGKGDPRVETENHCWSTLILFRTAWIRN